MIAILFVFACASFVVMAYLVSRRLPEVRTAEGPAVEHRSFRALAHDVLLIAHRRVSTGLDRLAHFLAPYTVIALASAAHHVYGMGVWAAHRLASYAERLKRTRYVESSALDRSPSFFLRSISQYKEGMTGSIE